MLVTLGVIESPDGSMPHRGVDRAQMAKMIVIMNQGVDNGALYENSLGLTDISGATGPRPHQLLLHHRICRPRRCG